MLGIRRWQNRWELMESPMVSHPSRRCRSIDALTEPLYVWQFWVAKFRSVIRVARFIECGKPPNAAEWEMATSFDLFRPPLDLGLDTVFWSQVPSKYTIDDAQWKRQTNPKSFKEEEARTYLYSRVFDWVRFAQLMIFLDPFRSAIAVSTPGLFAGLTLQLVLAINRTSFVQCDGCTEFITPNRRPRSDRPLYCAQCQTNHVAWKMGKRESRRREQAKKNATDVDS